MRKIVTILIIVFLGLLLGNVYAGYRQNPYTGKFDEVPTIEEEDGTPSVYAPSTIKFTNSSVTDNEDGSVSISITGGGDDVAVDSVDVTDPDFVSTGDIDFVNTSNTITANIRGGVIVGTDFANADLGSITVNAGSFSIDANAVGDTQIDETTYGATVNWLDDASDATSLWTWQLSGATDPAITFGNNLVNISTGVLQAASQPVVTDNNACTELEGTKLSITGGTLNCTETDSVVGAVNGVVKADGGGNISACSNLTDTVYLTSEADTLQTVFDRGNDITQSSFDQWNWACSSATGTEDSALIFLNDDRTGATANEIGEATIVIDAEGTYALYILDGAVWSDQPLTMNNNFKIEDTGSFYIGSGNDIVMEWDTNSTGDDLFVIFSSPSASDSDAFFFTHDNPDAMTDHDNYLSPTLILANSGSPDANDYAGVVIGERTQNDVTITHYFDLYAMTGSADDSVNATTTEIAAMFRTGDSGTATSDHSLSSGDWLFEDDVEIDGMLWADGGVTGNLTGNASGSSGSCTGQSATVATITGLAPDTATTQATQPNITSLGTLTTLTVDDITINGNTISSAGASTLAITPTAGQTITFDGTVTLDAGVIAGATSITSTAFVGALTGNADTVTTNANLTGEVTSVGNTTTIADSITVATWTLQGATLTGDINAGGADFELPQGQTPDTDGDVDLDFTDGSLVIQHGSAHAELASSTDVVMGKLIHSWTATLAFPDLLQAEIDNWEFKSINAEEFPHGVVITAISLETSASSTYAINVENWDDPTTINGANPTIDAITTSSSTEVLEDTITYSTIAAGQIIMLDLPTTDIGWVTITIFYYEPIA